MNIEQLFEDMQSEMRKQKGDSFTIDYQKSVFGVLQSVAITIIFAPLFAFMLYAALKTEEWHFSALAGYFSFVFYNYGLLNLAGALAMYTGYSKTKAKEEVIGR